MTTKHRPRFDVDVLRELAGKKVFARGEAYYRDGQVEILAVEPGRVLAQVTGTEDYRTELKGNGEGVDGECSSPAWEDWGFCKHMVATALAANDLRADQPNGSGAFARIRDHLKEKGIDVLVEMIMDLVERDPALFRKRDAAAVAMNENEKTLGMRMRKMVDSATSTRDFIDYREASHWAAHVESVLASVAALASGACGGLALELAERAIDRIAQAVEQIDDSDGHWRRPLARARALQTAAAPRVPPQPIP